jgi:N-acetyltransferase 10
VDDHLSPTRLTLVQEELGLPVNQALALFVKSIRKVNKRLTEVQKSALEAELPQVPAIDGSGDPRSLKAAETLEKMKPVDITIEDELREAGDKVTRELRGKQREMINSLDLSKYVFHSGFQNPKQSP